jgi:GAF domain-containing protein
MSVETATRTEFFTDCAECEAADAVGGRVYYFKLAEPSEEISALYSLSTDPELWEPWWVEYLTLKYEALTIFNYDPGCRAEKAIERLDLDDSYTEVIERWQRQAPLEARVYRLRLEQIGDHETVKAAWYDDIPGLDRWVASCKAADPANPGEDEAGRAEREARLATALDPMLVSTEPDARARDGVAALLGARRAIIERLGEDGVEQLYAVGEGGVLPVDQVAAELAEVTLNLVARRQRDLTQHVGAVMAIVREGFDASVVDFLLLRRRPRVEQLEFLATTAEVTEGERKQLEHEAAYARPVGITGAVLVAQHDHEMFHVGTNLLEDDPRQSPTHRSAYERLYGKVRNFWVFPLHMGDELVGALRVVNRLDSDGNVVSWPFLQRRRLVGLTKFVGALWQAYGIEIPLDGPEAPPQHIGQVVNEAAERCLAAAESLTLGAGGEMSGEALAGVLAALAAQAEVRIEDRRLRATALIVAPDRLDGVGEVVAPGRFVPVSRVPSLAELDRASSSDGNVLVIRTDGRIAGRVSSPAGRRLDAVPAANRMGAEFCVRVSDRERLLEVWRKGEHVADYAFVMRAGVWRLRAFAAAARDLAGFGDFDLALLEDLVRKAIRHSYKEGAMIVAFDHRLPSHFPKQRLKRSLESLSEEEFDEYAHKDGGCIVSSAGVLEQIQVMFPTNPPELTDEDVAERFRASQRRLRESMRGTRHEAALSASLHLPDAVVLCASANRTVCAFVNGATVLWDS